MSEEHNQLDNRSPANDHAVLGGTLIALLTLAFGGAAIVLLYAKWRNLDPYMLDFAKQARTAEELLAGGFHYSMTYYAYIYAGFNSLLFVPYLLTRSIAVNLFIHVFGMTAAIPLLYRLARRVLPGISLPLAIAVLYALNPSINMITLGMFRGEALWIVAFLFCVSFLQQNKIPGAIVAASLAMFIRADSIPIFFLFGATLWLQRKKRLGKIAMVHALLMIVFLVGAMLIIYAITGTPPVMDQFHINRIVEGESASLLSRLSQTVFDIGSYRHLTAFLQLFLLPLLAPLFLLPALPPIAFIVLSYSSFQAIPLVHELLTPDNPLIPLLHVHDTFLFPILFVAAIYGLAKLTARNTSTDFARRFLAGAMIVGALVLHWTSASPDVGPVPLTPWFNCDYYRQTPHAETTWKILRSLPTDKPVLVQISLAERIYWHPQLSEIYPIYYAQTDADTILFDLYGHSSNMPKPQLLQIERELLQRNDYGVTLFTDGLVVLKKFASRERNPEVLAFIAEHETMLAQNLDNPYKYGFLPREQARRRVYTDTQLPK